VAGPGPDPLPRQAASLPHRTTATADPIVAGPPGSAGAGPPDRLPTARGLADATTPARVSPAGVVLDRGTRDQA